MGKQVTFAGFGPTVLIDHLCADRNADRNADQRPHTCAYSCTHLCPHRCTHWRSDRCAHCSAL
jgi:hypothetical protein